MGRQVGETSRSHVNAVTVFLRTSFNPRQWQCQQSQAHVFFRLAEEFWMPVCLFHKLTMGFAVVGVINGVLMQETFKARESRPMDFNVPKIFQCLKDRTLVYQQVLE